MESTIKIYNFPETDYLNEEIKLITLDRNLSYATQKPHRHNYFELFFFTNGGGTHSVDFKKYTIHANSLHLVMPGALHLINRKINSSGYVILFTETFLYTALSDFKPFSHQKVWLKTPVYKLSNVDASFINVLILNLKNELLHNKTLHAQAVGALLKMIFIVLYRLGKQNDNVMTNTIDSDLVHQFYDVLERTFLQNMSAESYAKQLNCSLNKLNNSLHKEGCQSVIKIITERKILEAKRLLAYTNWSVKEITYHLGYEDPDYFGKVFKKQSRKTPIEFREENK